MKTYGCVKSTLGHRPGRVTLSRTGPNEYTLCLMCGENLTRETGKYAWWSRNYLIEEEQDLW